MESYDCPHSIQVVSEFVKLFQTMLDKARDTQKTHNVSPALHKLGLPQKFKEMDSKFLYFMSPESRKQVIDAAARKTFNKLLVSRTQLKCKDHKSDQV